MRGEEGGGVTSRFIAKRVMKAKKNRNCQQQEGGMRRRCAGITVSGQMDETTGEESNTERRERRKIEETRGGKAEKKGRKRGQ